MKYDGTTYYPCPRYHWRYKRPGDLDGSGEPLPEHGNWLVVYDRNDPEKEQAFHLHYTNTGGGYAVKVRTAKHARRMAGARPRDPEVFLKEGERYIEMRLFQAHDGRLYSTTRKYVTSLDRIRDFGMENDRLREALAVKKTREAASA